MSSRLPLLFSVALAGCSGWSLGPPARALPLAGGDVPPAQARICVLRSSAEAGGVTFPVRDNGVLVGATRGGTRFCYLAEPGEHHVVTEADSSETQSIIVEAGRSYYLQQEIDAVMGAVKCHTHWVEADQAQQLAAQSEEQVLLGVPTSEKLPGQPAFAPSHPATAVGSN
jgi:hypothetical protein